MDTCSAPSLWSGVTCQQPPHDDERHHAEDSRSAYVWTTAATEAVQRGACPGCLRYVCVCPCSCDQCARRKR